MYNGSKKTATKLKNIQSRIAKKWPSGAKFIGKIIGGLGSIVKKLQSYLGKILSKSNLKGVQKGVKPGKGFVPTVKTGGEFAKRAAVAGGVAGGISYGAEKLIGGGGNQEDPLDYIDTTGKAPALGVELDQDAIDL